MANNYNGNNAPEYNVNGDAANGRQGSYTNPAVMNRAQQTGGGNDNPYGAILNYVQTPQARMSTQPAAGGPNMGPGYLGSSTTSPGGPPLTKANTDPTPTTPPALNPQTGKPYAQVKPANVDQSLWDTTDRYVTSAAAQGKDYSFLYQHPEWITDFRNWALNTPGGTNVDIVDWLKHTHPEANSGLAGRSGMGDTYQNWTTNQPPPNAPTTPAGPTGPQYQAPPNDADLMRTLHQQYDPLNQQGQNELANQLRSEAALTGDSNSGAFGDVMGRQEGSLIAKQNADLGDKFLTSRENAMNRALSRYGIDSSFLTSANQQVVEKDIANQNYNAALAALGLDKYKFDNPGINELLAWYMHMSPEQLTQAGLGQIPWPNQVYTHP